MKIKLAILDDDRNYLEKLRAAFVRKYADEIEFYLFTAKQPALETLSRSKIDVFLLNKSMEISTDQIPHNCLYAYLSDVPGFDTFQDRPVICKFQRIDLIYKQILGVCAENKWVVMGGKASDGKAKTILFCGISGGMGTSSAAAACAVRFAGKKKKVLYMNLQRLSGADLYFSGEGQKDLSDLILSLQDSEANLALQLQSWVREDPTGVCFYSQAKNALDMMELNPEEMLRLITEANANSEYDYVILDTDLVLDRQMMQVYRAADEIVMVSDHSKEAAIKANRALAALRILDGGSESTLYKRICLLYNRVASEEEVDISDPEISVLGGIGICKNEKTRKVPQNRKIVETLSEMDMFDKVM